jgi:hypothetical protein
MRTGKDPRMAPVRGLSTHEGSKTMLLNSLVIVVPRTRAEIAELLQPVILCNPNVCGRSSLKRPSTR